LAILKMERMMNGKMDDEWEDEWKMEVNER
jgi:hypothetical protein